MNTINLKALIKLATELNIRVNVLESKLIASNISIRKTESMGFRTNREDKHSRIMRLY